jgi:ankyrin repeat protein
MTPLHLTAIHGSLAAANALLASGAGLAATTGELEIERDRSAIVFSRLDALHLAAAADNPAIVAALMEHGLQPSADPRTGIAPIHLAAWLGATESAVLLLDRGSPLTTRDEQGWSPMHHAAAGGCVEMIALLRARRSSLDEIGRDGASPLHVAAANGRSAVVRQLLALGARRSLRDARSETPYELTQRMLLTKEVLLSRRWRSEYHRIEKLLRPRGANAPSKT